MGQPDKKDTPDGVEDFGKKIKVLEGVIGYQFPASYFRNTQIAQWLGISSPELSRKFAGRRPVHNRELSILIKWYDLAHVFDYSVFLKPLKEFKAALADAKLGTYGIEASAGARQKLHARGKKNQSRITIAIAEDERRDGGMGPDDDGETDDGQLTFKVRDLVYAEIRTPSSGQLVVLNERVGDKISCLKPSSYSRLLRSAESPLRIPDPELSNHFRIRAPTGSYRLIAIWTSAKVDLPFPSFDSELNKFSQVSDHLLIEMSDRVLQCEEDAECETMVMCADYYVG